MGTRLQWKKRSTGERQRVAGGSNGGPPEGVAKRWPLWQSIHMKRTNLVLDTQLLNEATAVLQAKTWSAAVNLALAEVLRVRRIQQIPSFFGEGLWTGNLSQMREDKPRQRGRRRAK